MRRLPAIAAALLIAFSFPAWAQDAGNCAKSDDRDRHPDPIADAIDVAGSMAADEEADTEAPQAVAWKRYARELIAHLVDRGDARSLIAAALFSKSALLDSPDKVSEDLLRLARKADPNEPLAWRLTAMGTQDAADREEAVQRLIVLAPDNVSNWIFAVSMSRKSGDAPAMRSALAHAAEASGYSDYWTPYLQTVFSAMRSFPMPAQLSADQAMRDDASPETRSIALAFSMVAAIALPAYQDIVNECKPEKFVGDDAWSADCLAIARKMQNGDTLIAERMGHIIERHITAGTPAAAEAERNNRSSAWRAQQYSRLATGMELDGSWDRRYAPMFERGATEREVIFTVLGEAGVDLLPPDDWVVNAAPPPSRE
jgi:hypothetical protein